MGRLVPHPLLSLALVGMWLLLTRFSPGHLLLGTAIALIAGRAMAALKPDRPRIRRWIPALRLGVVVPWDILRSNIAVARLILTNGRRGTRRSGFIRIPLELRDPTGLAILSMIITATPGTAWIEHDRKSGVLILHIFDLTDEAAQRDEILRRYATPLMEIFQ
jgi:multicomponent K+:H+ antiporter subunit E